MAVGIDTVRSNFNKLLLITNDVSTKVRERAKRKDLSVVENIEISYFSYIANGAYVNLTKFQMALENDNTDLTALNSLMAKMRDDLSEIRNRI